MRLEDKVILITGSCTGIGKAIALRCVSEGARVVINGLEQDLGEDVVRTLGTDHAALHIEDLTVDGAPERMVQTAVTKFGKLADPIADKALTGMAFIGLSINGDLWWWVTIVILVREWGITLLRFVMLRYGVMAAGRGGKLKTVTQAVAVILYLLPLPGWAEPVAWVVMGIAFPASSALLPDDVRTAGSASGSLLAANTTGAIVGSFIVPFVLIPTLGSPRSVVVIAVFNVAMALALILVYRGRQAGKASPRRLIPLGMAATRCPWICGS